MSDQTLLSDLCSIWYVFCIVACWFHMLCLQPLDGLIYTSPPKLTHAAMSTNQSTAVPAALLAHAPCHATSATSNGPNATGNVILPNTSRSHS